MPAQKCRHGILEVGVDRGARQARPDLLEALALRLISFAEVLDSPEAGPPSNSHPRCFTSVTLIPAR